MRTILVMGFDGQNVDGTKWVIREGQRDLEEVGTRQEAVSRARNKWAAPGQPIKLVDTAGRTKMIRQGDQKGSAGVADMDMSSGGSMHSDSGSKFDPFKW